MASAVVAGSDQRIVGTPRSFMRIVHVHVHVTRVRVRVRGSMQI
jgi:hypothetical protein